MINNCFINQEKIPQPAFANSAWLLSALDTFSFSLCKIYPNFAA